jgi:hypothetical protein
MSYRKQTNRMTVRFRNIQKKVFYAGLKKHHTRAHALHTELQKVCMDEFNKAPDVRVIGFIPILRGIYDICDLAEGVMRRERHRMRRQSEHALSLSHKAMSSKQGSQNRSST